MAAKKKELEIRALLVEDNEINAIVVEGFLEHMGHHVKVVESGEAAVSAMGIM